jgi:hypothetical protein
MTEHSTQLTTAELQQTALNAREQLFGSLARLDQRVKHLASTAANASAASGWGIAALCAFWISAKLEQPSQSLPERFVARRSFGASLFTSAVRTVGFVAAGAMVYVAVRRARGAADVMTLPAVQPSQLLPAAVHSQHDAL